MSQDLASFEIELKNISPESSEDDLTEQYLEPSEAADEESKDSVQEQNSPVTCLVPTKESTLSEQLVQVVGYKLQLCGHKKGSTVIKKAVDLREV